VREPSRTATSSSRLRNAALESWLDRLLATPGLTAIAEREEAWRVHVEESLAALEVVRRYPGRVVDVGSGGGAPGIPLALALPEREVTLLEANGRKCAFLRDAARLLPNVEVVHGRAEEQGTDRYGVAVAKALAAPPVAAEWCLPLVTPGGAAVLYVGPSAEPEAVGRVAGRVGGGPVEELPGLLVLPKLEPTPPGFPRRAGMAKKRPLA
jgi:16S rRNA (guanine527-N7)-methyltransferase